MAEAVFNLIAYFNDKIVDNHEMLKVGYVYIFDWHIHGIAS